MTVQDDYKSVFQIRTPPSANGHEPELVRATGAVSDPRLAALLPHHRRMLIKGSGIASDIVAEQGYWSAHEPSQLQLLGLAPVPTPALVIPNYPLAMGPHDEPILCVRQDAPVDPSKKYLWPAGVPMRLTCHPRSRPFLGDASVPLDFVEGQKKGDSLLSHGRQCVVVLSGTASFGWKPEPGLPIMADWDRLAIANRLVRINFDSDAWRNPNVMRDMMRLTAVLQDRGAIVKWVRLPDAADGAKQGVDDWFVAGHDLAALNALVVDPEVDPIVGAPLDDFGNAERFAYFNADRARWCADHQRWYCWDGRRWDDANAELVTRFAKETVRATQIAAARLPNANPNRAALMDHAAKMGARYRAEAMVSMARSELTIRASDLDSDPWLLNCGNGTVDLRTGDLRPHDPADLISLLAPVDFDPEAVAPEFERFIADVLDGDGELVDFVQRVTGYTLTGMTNEQAYVVLTGDGGNGKGVLIRLMTAVMGSYALNLPAAALHRGRSSAQGFDVADLPGKRLATSSETTTTNHLDEQRIKALTGQEPFTAEHKYGRPFTFTPVAKLVLAVNGLPPTDDASEGFWRRPAVIHFPNQYSPEDDPTLWDRLTAELPGILAWTVRGCIAWQRRSLRPFPAAVSAAVQEWRSDEDPLAAFLTECCDGLGEDDARVAKGDLLMVYRQWCRDSGEEEIKTKGRGAQWTKSLKRHDITVVVEAGVARWKGVRLNPQWAEWVAHVHGDRTGGQMEYERRTAGRAR